MTGVLVRLRVGDAAYTVPVSHVLEVVPYGDVWQVPGAGPAALGVRNLRGEVLPVFDLAAALSPAPARTRARLVVVESDGYRAALAIDEVLDVGPGTAGDDARPVDIGRVLAALAEDGS